MSITKLIARPTIHRNSVVVSGWSGAEIECTGILPFTLLIWGHIIKLLKEKIA